VFIEGEAEVELLDPGRARYHRERTAQLAKLAVQLLQCGVGDWHAGLGWRKGVEREHRAVANEAELHVAVQLAVPCI
jgi:hypothetical protein